MDFTNYRLPDGRIVPVDASAAKGAHVIGFTLKGGQVVDATRVETEVEAALLRVYREADGLVADVDKLAIQVERLLRERAHITEVLRRFYRSTLSLSSAQAVINLALELDPTLGQAEQLPLRDTTESV